MLFTIMIICVWKNLKEHRKINKRFLSWIWRIIHYYTDAWAWPLLLLNWIIMKIELATSWRGTTYQGIDIIKSFNNASVNWCSMSYSTITLNSTNNVPFWQYFFNSKWHNYRMTTKTTWWPHHSIQPSIILYLVSTYQQHLIRIFDFVGIIVQTFDIRLRCMKPVRLSDDSVLEKNTLACDLLNFIEYRNIMWFVISRLWFSKFVLFLHTDTFRNCRIRISMQKSHGSVVCCGCFINHQFHSSILYTD